MAQIVLSEAGAALGRRALSSRLNIAGVGLSGASLGRSAGTFIGRALDNAFADPREGPRMAALHIMEAREGAGIPNVYGRMRVGGQLIWVSRFRERRSVGRVGGKGGSKAAHYDYTVSFAVALGEGHISAIRRVYANGEPFDLSSVPHRFYAGDETQGPDPLIDMLEGAAPAYRGVAYIVFEDLPLEAFGNRLPQLSFEVERAPPGGASGLVGAVTAVNIIPASGEFVYETGIVREVIAPGVERAINANSGEARADFLVSMDQLAASLPNVDAVSLTIGWFGASLDAAACTIAPGVETRERTTRPQVWSVAGLDRAQAYLISKDASGASNYGGTPSDASVIAAIQNLKARGWAVTLTPFLFMDVPGFPWRGRIGVAADRTSSARSSIAAFVNRADGYRRFVLHQASLAAEAGGVDAFLIGSEMRGLTRVRDESGAFPFVEALVTLAADIKAILPGAKISYAADWTEYGAYAPGDGSNDVLFPLDPLWASSAVDFIGIDWYPPMGDWRDGGAHTDALAGFRASDDPAYLTAQFAGGEAYDWYYASDADRQAQVRTPINDTSHNEHWIFRAKDILNWSSNAHYPRPGGLRAAFPTAFVPSQKPVRFSEIGFGAIDKGGNAPNLFIDPKSSESALPPFSNGARNDLFQARALSTVLAHVAAQPLISGAYVWAWDARPFPAWPLRLDVWGDGENWARGHWLNGRAGLSSLAAVVSDLCTRAGVANADVSGLEGAVEGYTLDGPMALRGALEPLRLAHGFHAVERHGVLVFEMEHAAPVLQMPASDLVEPGLALIERLIDKAPHRLRLTYLDTNAEFAPALAEARIDGADPRLVSDVALPMALTPARASALASRLLAMRRLTRTASGSLPGNTLTLEPGDRVAFDEGEVWRIDDITDSGFERQCDFVRDVPPLADLRVISPGTTPTPAVIASDPELVIIDAAAFPATMTATGPYIAAFADPWPGEVRVLAGLSEDAMTLRATVTAPARIARLLAPVARGPAGRWDRVHVLTVHLRSGGFESVTPTALLAGANTAWLETDLGWECLQFRDAVLTGPQSWRLSSLLRAQSGTLSGDAAIGARLVFSEESIVRASVAAGETGSALIWRADRSNTVATQLFEDRAGLAWSVAHLRQRGQTVSWTRRGADLPESWSLPEAPAGGRFVIEVDAGQGFGAPIEQTAAMFALPPGAQRVRVSQLGSDGRAGRARTLTLA